MNIITAAQKFGWDAPHRILTTTNYYAGALEMPLPGEPMYPTVLPFINVAGLSISGGPQPLPPPEWRGEPERLDLYFYEGDDVVVPVTIPDPLDPAWDLADSIVWTWQAQIRLRHDPESLLIAEFAIEEVVHTPAAPPDVPAAHTQVSLFLPRADNLTAGDFSWDLQALNEDDRVKTFVYGNVAVIPHVTVIPGEEEIPPEPEPDPNAFNSFLAISVGSGRTVGPTGQIG